MQPAISQHRIIKIFSKIPRRCSASQPVDARRHDRSHADCIALIQRADATTLYVICCGFLEPNTGLYRRLRHLHSDCLYPIERARVPTLPVERHLLESSHPLFNKPELSYKQLSQIRYFQHHQHNQQQQQRQLQHCLGQSSLFN